MIANWRAMIGAHWKGLAACCLIAAVPLLHTNPYFLHVITIFFLYTILSMGLSIVVGFAGLLDLGYVAFFAVGAYFYAILNTTIGLSFWPAIPIAAFLSAVFGIVIGVPTLRVRGDYLAVVTLAFGEMVRHVLLNWSSVTKGPRGIPAIAPLFLESWGAALPTQYFYITFAVVVLSIIIIKRLSVSPMALIWEAIRDDEVAARACGINSLTWLLLAFAVGASFAGVTGVFFAAIQRFVSPESFVLDESILILSIVVLAGGKSLPRIFLASAILYLLPELLRGCYQYRTLIFGILLIGFTIGEHRFAYLLRKNKKQAPLPDIFQHKKATKALSGFSDSYSILKVENVIKNFSGLRALNGVSFSIKLGGTIHALIGPNGAGKTTLFNCLSGLEKVDSGKLYLGGVGELSRLKPFQIARLGLGRTFQRVHVFKSMTVRQNVLLGSFCGRRIPTVSTLWQGKRVKNFWNSCNQTAESCIGLVEIQDYSELPVSSLPIGIQRKVEIARALALDPQILLLDEIASGLNDAEKKELAITLKNLTDKYGISIIVVEHDMGFVMNLADNIIVLDSGEVLAEGKPSEISSDERVTNAYLGSFVERHAFG